MFFEKIVPPGSFKVTASGGRGEAFHDFCIGLKTHREDYVILLVDSEEPVKSGCWEHLKARIGDNWPRPADAHEDQAQLMVQSMEAWLLADHPALITYYGQGFLAKSLPQRANVEQISKKEALDALEHASKPTTKGEYHKTRHGFDLLEIIDPLRVRNASVHAKLLFEVLSRETA
jgi:hypothetical protein